MNSGIQIQSRFYWLQWILFLCTPRMIINGKQERRLNWGQTFVPVDPGTHIISVYFKYFFIPINHATINLTVNANAVVHLKYHSALFIFSSGSIRSGGERLVVPPAPSVPPVAFHAFINNSQAGPFNRERLIQLITEKSISLDTPMWTQGMGNWSMAKEIPYMRDLINEQQAEMIRTQEANKQMLIKLRQDREKQEAERLEKMKREQERAEGEKMRKEAERRAKGYFIEIHNGENTEITGPFDAQEISTMLVKGEIKLTTPIKKGEQTMATRPLHTFPEFTTDVEDFI